MMIGRKDARVLKSFSEQRPEVGHKLTTDGVRLDGLWMGGTGIAAWSGGKIELGDLGSKAALSVQRSLMAYVAPNDIRKSNPHRSEPAGVCESCMKQGRPGERWILGDVCDDCAYDMETMRSGTAAQKAAAKKAMKARAAAARRGNPTGKRRRNPDGKVLATTAEDRNFLLQILDYLRWEEETGQEYRRRQGQEPSAHEARYLARIVEMYDRIANL